MNEWQILDVPEKPELHNLAIRLNSLGSLFFFSKSVLKRDRLSNNLHQMIARSVEREKLHLVLEVPRDHMKSTLITESLSMWWALPFTEFDEEAMRTLGYKDEWIRWMKIAHNPNTRTLLVSENEPNAIRFGRRIDSHYESNDTFRTIFPEILPDAKSTWNDKSKTQKRTVSGMGEGTYEFLGVGGAVQSRHYDRIIEDDLVGRDAKNSELVMADTIEYHRLLSGVFDSSSHSKTELGNEVVVGNRWSYYDLNGWIREHEPDFHIETHSALGGCCTAHPAGECIFPEEFTPEKLRKIESRLSVEDYHHQYLNTPLLPGEQPFDAAWLKHYELYESKDKRAMIKHETYNGKVIGDIPVSLLSRALIVDPNHAESEGTSNHAVIAVGYDRDSDYEYLLDEWAKSTSYDDLCAIIYKFAKRWRLTAVWLEKIAGQQLLRYPLAARGKVEDYKIDLRYLEVKRTKDFKDLLIRSKEPTFRNGKFWNRSSQQIFETQYKTYPTSRMKDVINCVGYTNEVFDKFRFKEAVGAVKAWNARVKGALQQSI